MLEKLQARFGMTSFMLKVIGIVLMVGDHMYDMWYYVGAPAWMGMTGRIVAPIFLFLSAEGFHYTHSKIGYLRNLLIGFWITSAVELILPNIWPNDHIVLINSIFGTLFLSILAMWTWDALLHPIKNKKAFGWGLLGLVYLIGTTVAFFALASQTAVTMLFTFVVPTIPLVEGNIVFILLALLFHIFREHRWLQIVALLAVAALSFTAGGDQWMMGFAAILLALYNGKQGRKDKWFFYIFYPTHIAVLYLIATWFF